MAKLSNNSVIATEQKRIADSLDSVMASKATAPYMQLCDSEGLSFEEKGVVAGLLQNYNENLGRISDAEATAVDITTSDYGPYVPELLPLITAWYPEFPLKDIICVQNTKKPLGWLFFSKLKVNTDKGDQFVGDEVETPLGMRKIKGTYPTGEVFGEVVYDGEGEAPGQVVLAYAPLKVQGADGHSEYWMKKFKIVTDDGTDKTTYKATSWNGVDTITLADADANTITINTQDGEVTGLTAAAGTSITANYVWDLDYANNPDPIQSVKEEIERVAIECQPRAISMEWTVFAEYLKKSQWGQDIRTANTKRILNLLYQFQVRYIIDDLTMNATGAEVAVAKGFLTADDLAVTIPVNSVMSLDVRCNMVLEQLYKIANTIERISGRIQGNKILCGRNFKVFCESLNNTWFKAMSGVNDGKGGFSAARKIGDFSTFEVYYDPTMEDDFMSMLYRGSEWYDAVYYMLEFMPIMPSDAIQLGVTIRESFCAMEAYFYHKPECVINFTIANE